MSLQWTRASHGQVPRDAFITGSHDSGSRLFVARAEHNGTTHPCKLHEGHNDRAAHLSWGGIEHLKYEYEVLGSDIGLYWKSMRVGHLPRDAVSTGYEHGAPLYTVKGRVCGKTSIGKYSTQHHIAYFPYNGKEHEVKHGEVEVLCFKV